MMLSSTKPLIPTIINGPSDLSHRCFCNDEEILEALTTPKYPWDDMHHHLFFLPERTCVAVLPFFHGNQRFHSWESQLVQKSHSSTKFLWRREHGQHLTNHENQHFNQPWGCWRNHARGILIPRRSCCLQIPLPRILWHFFLVLHWNSWVGSTIVEHHIDTWPNVAPMCQKQWPIHPSKAVAIKDKIEKLCMVGFFYPIAYTTWDSNHVLMKKKQGTIHVCTDFYDLNWVCPKDNFPTPFID